MDVEVSCRRIKNVVRLAHVLAGENERRVMSIDNPNNPKNLK